MHAILCIWAKQGKWSHCMKVGKQKARQRRPWGCTFANKLVLRNFMHHDPLGHCTLYHGTIWCFLVCVWYGGGSVAQTSISTEDAASSSSLVSGCLYSHAPDDDDSNPKNPVSSRQGVETEAMCFQSIKIYGIVSLLLCAWLAVVCIVYIALLYRLAFSIKFNGKIVRCVEMREKAILLLVVLFGCTCHAKNVVPFSKDRPVLFFRGFCLRMWRLVSMLLVRRRDYRYGCLSVFFYLSHC